MKVAQELYEGVDIEGMGATGLITYMRTDSLRISNVAIEEVTEYIKNSYGEKFLPPRLQYPERLAKALCHQRPVVVERLLLRLTFNGL